MGDIQIQEGFMKHKPRNMTDPQLLTWMLIPPQVVINSITQCKHWQRDRQIWYKNKLEYAHRLVWYLYHTFWPVHELLRTCGIPTCINPHHLLPGTHQDSMSAMVDRGRQSKGVSVHTAKFTEEQVLRIRKLYTAGGYTQLELAKTFGVARASISQITRRASWKHI